MMIIVNIMTLCYKLIKQAVVHTRHIGSRWADDWLMSPWGCFFLFLSFGVTVNAEAGMIVHSQR